MSKIQIVVAKIFDICILRLSSDAGRLHLRPWYSLVWSPYPKFKIWAISDQWWLRYLRFFLLSSSSKAGCLHLRPLCTLGFGPLNLSLKFEKEGIKFFFEVGENFLDILAKMQVLYTPRGKVLNWEKIRPVAAEIYHF